jgi:hypothetical protein
MPPNPQTEVVHLEPRPVQSQQSGLTIRDAYEAATSGKLNAESVAVLERLLALDATKQFTTAFVALQAELPVITAKSVIPNRGKYEKFEDIMHVISPLLTKHGFTVSFSQDFKENRILEICTLSHAAGHSRSNSFAVRAGGRSDSETQADCKASTTAKRNALCNALNIVIRQDCLNEENDASIEGDPNAKVTPAQAQELERRVKETNSDVAAFLRFAQSKSFAEIPANRYAELDAFMRRKESKGR